MENSGLRWISVLLMFSGILFGTLQLRKKVNGGYLTYGQGFSAGFFMVLIITVVAVIATSIDIQLHPDYIKCLKQSRINMINKGYTDQQIEMSMHYAQKFSTPGWIAFWILLFDLFFGTIISLITAGIATKKKPIFDETDTAQSNDIPQV